MGFRVVAIPLFAAICLASPAIISGEQVRKGRGYTPREGGDGQTASKSGGDTKSGSGAAGRSGGGDRTEASTSRPAERRAESQPEERRGVTRPPAERRTEERRTDERRAETADNAASDQRRGEARSAERDDEERQRYAVRRGNNAVVNSPPRITSRDVRSNDYRDRSYYRVVRNDWPRINVNIGSSYGGHYAPVHYDYWARQYLRWSPIHYAPWSLIYGSIGFPNYGFYGGVGPSPFSYGYNGYSSYGAYPNYGYPHEAGGVRLNMRPRDAQVFVDGYYAGRVDDFDGVFQALKLEAGGHKIEVRMPGFEDLALDVHVQPGRTITLREDLRLRP